MHSCRRLSRLEGSWCSSPRFRPAALSTDLLVQAAEAMAVAVDGAHVRHELCGIVIVQRRHDAALRHTGGSSSKVRS